MRFGAGSVEGWRKFNNSRYEGRRKVFVTEIKRAIEATVGVECLRCKIIVQNWYCLSTFSCRWEPRS